MPLTLANHCAWHKQAARRLVESIRDLSVEGEWRLEIEDRGLVFETRLQGQKTRFEHSFLDPRLRQRAMQKNQGLLRACNSFLLAAAGHEVTMLEQQPLIAHCVEFLLHIARSEDPVSPCHRMRLVHGNALDYLREGQTADACYLDPMFPTHKSGAKPGKELQILQRLTENRDMEPLFEAALEEARQRVVVKRPLHAPPLMERKPSLQYREKTIRFDIYL